MSNDDFNFTWGIPELGDLGFVPVYQFMLRTYTKLGLTRQEMLLIVHLASYHYNSPGGESRPSLQTIAEEMGYSHKNRVSELITSLKDKGMLWVDYKAGMPSTYNLRPFAQQAMANFLEGVTKKRDTGVTEKRDTVSRKTVTKEYEEEEEDKNTNHPSIDGGPGELSYESFDGEDWPEAPKPPIIQHINAVEHRAELTSRYERRLARPVTVGTDLYDSPTVLYEKHPLFKHYVEDKIQWAEGNNPDQKRMPNSALIGAIRNYGTKTYGWLDWLAERKTDASNQEPQRVSAHELRAV